MNFRYKLMQFFSGRYGVDTLFFVMIIVASVTSVAGGFLRLFLGMYKTAYIMQLFVYLIVILAILRTMSRNFEARRRENRVFANLSVKLGEKFKTYRQRKADTLHVYKRCPRCKSVLRLPRRAGKHTVTCPRCDKQFKVFIKYKHM